jgi:A/G-specific adenine glycosylase
VGGAEVVTESDECGRARASILARERALIARVSAENGPDLDPAVVRAFRRLVLDHHASCGRHDLEWRRTGDPYAILVSEVMLQQTQVPRVAAVYPRFLERFPNVHVLADTPLSDVLEAWRGMGYNRRALALKRTAEKVVAEHGGRIPRTKSELVALPGIGPATASAVLASAFGVAEPYIETNIRAVVLHVFFHDDCDVPDAEVLRVVTCTLPKRDARTWYFALMDYGNWLKRREVNPCRRSRHHAVQAAFAGSARQVRGEVLRALVERGPSTERELAEATALPAERVGRALEALGREGLVEESGATYRVP